MLFNSFSFILLFPFIFLLYWVIPSNLKTARKVFLIILSYALYICFNAAYALILLGITIITYLGGLLFNDQQNSKHLLIWLFSIIAILPLLIFKYYNFIIEVFEDVLGIVGLPSSISGLNWAIPVGISFYTFQAVGYMLDVYRGKVRAEKNFMDYSLFISFFPQIVSGPISQASELLPQIKSERTFDYPKAVEGLKVLLWGVFMKVVVADRAGIYVEMVFSNYSHFSGLNCFIGSVLYSIQIYSDFCGYSLMAVGVGKLLGFDLIYNFNRPYFATTITDFWRRWHISLTRWLTQNIYIPLGGSKCSKVKCYWNIIITFLVSGIWHGANWTFIIWGIIHGGIQIVEKIFGLQKPVWGKLRIIRMGVTFLCVNFAWIFFRSPSVEAACGYISQIFTKGSFSMQGAETLLYLIIGGSILIGKEFIQEFFPSFYSTTTNNLAFRWLSYGAIIIAILLLGVFDGGQFIYSNF